MTYCNCPNCSTPKIKPLTKAHEFLCSKSEKYHDWHHHPHHKKVHFATLGLCATTIIGLILSSLFVDVRLSKAANGFSANYNAGSLNADSGLGSTAASNDGTPASLVSPGYNEMGQAAQLTNGKTLKYSASSNLSDSEGMISLQAKYPGVIEGDWDGGFNSPQTVFYHAGTDLLYIADTSNNRIVVVKPDGVTGWRSFGLSGTGDGQLNVPSGVTVDSSGNIYVADSTNHRIQIFDNAGSPLGWIGKSSAYAGWHDIGSDGTGAIGSGDYSFNSPKGVALDSNNRLYVADYGNYRIQVYDNDASHTMLGWIGKSSTDAGWYDVGSGKVGVTGSGDYNFNLPYAIALDSNNKIYVAEYSNHRIQVFDNDASHTMLGWMGKSANDAGWHALGSGKIGTSGSGDYNFNAPRGVAIDSNNRIYVAEYTNNRIQVFDNDASHTMLGWMGKSSTDAGWHDVGSGKVGVTGSGDYNFAHPSGVTLDSNNKIYVADTTNNRIQVFDNDASHTVLGWTGEDTTSISGWHAVGSDESPRSLSASRPFNGVTEFYYDNVSGKMFIGNTFSTNVDGDKIIETNFDGTDWSAYSTNSPNFTLESFYYDEASQNLFVAEKYSSVSTITILKLDGSNSKKTINVAGSVSKIYYDSVNDYIYYTLGTSIARIKSDGTGLLSMGSSGTGVGNFSGASAIMAVPSDDPANPYLYIVDSSNARIVKTKLDGSWTGWTTYGTSGTRDAIGKFSTPKGIAYDNVDQYFYISDGHNRIVKTKLDDSWTGWTTYGIFGASGEGKFNGPQEIYYDDGFVYVANAGNRSIIKTDMDSFWETYDGTPPSQVLLQSSNSTNSLRLEIDPFRGKVRFYPSYNSSTPNNSTYLESATLDWTRDSWHSISASYKQSTGELSLTVDGVTTSTTTSWSAPAPNYGDDFYVGSVPGGGFDTFSGLIDKLKIFDVSSDLVNPSSPTNLTSLSASGGDEIISNEDHWHNHANPYFSWSGDSDTNGIDGYYVYFGTSNTADPEETSGVLNADGSVYWTESPNATVAGALVSGSTYYLRVKIKDNFGNSTIWDPTVSSKAFKYQYENTLPTNPSYVSSSPSGYSSVNDYTFLWPAGSDAGSGLSGYKYKTGGGDYANWSNITTELQVTLNGAWYQEGSNIFYLKTIDNAGNESSPVQATFYHNDSAPSAPQNLTASPESSEQNPSASNNFSFSWSKPATFSGNESALKYYYSINETPNSTNITLSTTLSLAADSYATRQGQNTIYVVAKDEAGNINYDIYASASFWAITPAPGTPTAVSAVDGSNRDLASYKVFLTWSEPQDKGAGFMGYNVYRSTDGINFSQAGTTTSTTFADTSLSSQAYFYNVESEDNAGQTSVASSTVQIVPTGKFSNAPIIKNEKLDVVEKAYSATISWETTDVDPKVVHKASSFVEYGTDPNKIGQENGGETKGQLSLTDQHSVTITGLQPGGALYYYQAVWVDENGNEGRSEKMSFRTLARPIVSVAPVDNISLNSATISYTTSIPTTTSIVYSKDKDEIDKGAGKVEEVETGYIQNHTINLSGLDHSSKYYYYILGSDVDGNKMDFGAKNDFNTLTMPAITNGVRSDQDTTAPTTTYRFSWETNVETTTIINYESSSGQKLSRSSADYTINHDLIIPDLADMSTYKFIVTGRDKYGNEIETPFTTSIDTPKDSRSPKISNMTIEVKSSGFGTSQKAQVVVTWETDEPGTSQVEYEQGISGSEYKNKSKEDAVLSTSHVVIVSELESNKIYHLRAISKDNAGNAGYSDDTTTITGKTQSSVIDIIVDSLQKSLSWIMGIFK
ncbi:MAG: fibronectin type III domain-containing protein [Patescibacteria group bacterium]